MLANAGGRLGRNALFLGSIIFFGTPVVWLLLAPSKTSAQLLSRNPISFGSFGEVGTAWHNLFGYNSGILNNWILNSVWYTFASVALALLTTIPAGYALAKLPFRGSTTLLFVTLVTMIVPGAALVLPLYLEMAGVHLVNTPWSVILPQAFYPFGVYMIYLYARMNISDSLIEAARLDGCSEFSIMMRIFVPLARPAIVMIGFFSVVGSWNSFYLPFIMLTSNNLATLQTGLQILISSTGAISGGNLTNIPIHEAEVALAAIISVLPILLVFAFAQRYLVAGQTFGAEKG